MIEDIFKKMFPPSQTSGDIIIYQGSDQLAEYYNDLSRREEALAQEKRDLYAQKEQLKSDMDALQQQRDTLEKAREDVRRQADLTWQYERLKQQYDALSVEHAKLLDSWCPSKAEDAKLNERKADLDKQARIMEDIEKSVRAREHDLMEREALLAIKAEHSSRSPETAERRKELAARMSAVSNGLLLAVRDLQNMESMFKSLRTEVAALNRGVTRAEWQPGLTELCLLYRVMEGMTGEDIKRLCLELKTILTESFSLVPLMPERGTLFNSRLYERKDMTQKGSTVVCCRACGWQMEDEVLLRAVVDVADAEGGAIADEHK